MWHVSSAVAILFKMTPTTGSSVCTSCIVLADIHVVYLFFFLGGHLSLGVIFSNRCIPRLIN